MNNKMRYRKCSSGIVGLIFILVGAMVLPTASFAALDNKGKDFIVSFLFNSLGRAVSEQVQLHLTGDVATTVTVEYPVNSPTFTTTVNVVPGSVSIVTLPLSASFGWSIDNIGNNSIRAFADQEFVVYMINRRIASTDAALALPIDTMNNEYLVLDYNPRFVGAQFNVTAAFDNTTVTITPSTSMVGRAAGVPFSVIINRGEAYFGRGLTTALSNTLTGTIISSDKPVGVTNGNGCTQVPTGVAACDHIFEVAQSVQSWGTRVMVVNLPNRPNGTIYRILASEDDTTITQDGTGIGVLNRGEFIETAQIAGSHIFEANKPIFVGQYMTGQNATNATLGDPAMGNMVPSQQYLSDYTFSTVGDNQFAQNFLTVIAENADVGSLLLDGILIPAAEFTPINSTGFSSAVVILSQGSHTTSSSLPHGITVEGYNSYDSYIYPGGALFQFINPVGDANPPVCSLVAGLDPGTLDGTAQDNRPTEDTNGNGVLDPGEDLNGNGKIDVDTGIFFVDLEPGSTNLTITVETFVPGDGTVGFNVAPIDVNLPAIGTVVATDGAGNTCEEQVNLGTFDPFRGIIRTPTRDFSLLLLRPSPDTFGVRCVETIPPGSTPDFSGVPFDPFLSGEIEQDILLSEGSGEKEVCCQFIDNSDNESPAACATIILDDQPVPDAPSDLTGRAKPGKTDLVWTTVVGADRYDVFRSSTSGGPYDPIGSSDTGIFIDTNATAGETFHYVVQSVNGGGNSANSNEFSVTVPTESARRRR